MPDSKPDVLPHHEWLLSNEEWAVARIEQWLGLVKKSIYPYRAPLQVVFAPCLNPRDLSGRKSAEYRPINLGDMWGRAWDYGWFRFTGQLPAEWAGMRVDARVNLGGEAGVIAEDGEFSGRLTHGSVFDHWIEVDNVKLVEEAAGGETVSFEVQAWASNLDGVCRPPDPDPSQDEANGKFEAILKRAELCAVDNEAEALLHDAEVLLGIARRSPEYSVRRRRIVRALLTAVFAWKDDRTRAAEARAVLAPELAKPAAPSALEAVATGHAHIDTAWMWRLGDSIGKLGRSFSTQCANLENYPEFVFGASSPIHYALVKEHFPRLYEKMKRFIAEGRWEIQGAMWVEPDTNVPSGESLIRQFLYGQKFLKEEFGVHAPIAWLPDVFGLSGCIPQICREGGVKYLMTKKIHWGRINLFTKTAFRWTGLDGSEVVVHILPQVRDYNGRMESDYLYRAQEGFTEGDRLDKFLYTVGVGDGGGGPTEPMLNRARRMRSIEGLPRVRFGTAREVFEHLDEKRDLLELHQGDLYVEGHRGTYTSQARLKRQNRQLEILLGQTECLFSLLPPEDYPHGELEEIWRLVLTNQFHDVLPGSGIREVIKDAVADYDQCFERHSGLLTRFNNTLPEMSVGSSLFNMLTVPWRGCLEAATALAVDGRQVLAQKEPDGQTVSYIEMNPLCFVTVEENQTSGTAKPLNQPVLENGHLRCEFDNNGQIVSLVEKRTGREMISRHHTGNRLGLYVDRPIDWDAWDIDRYYLREHLGNATAAGNWNGWYGPVRSVLEFHLAIGNSTIRQRCILENDGRRIDFETTVDWKERHRMLRAGFDTSIAGGIARNGVQHGFIDRPTHVNTTQQEAHFETPCQRYACLLGGDIGLAVLNDSKYGIRIESSTIELALLRSPTFPDYAADVEEHRFTYSVMPFSGVFEESGVPEEADRLNVSPLVLPGHDASGLELPFTLNAQGVTLECMKRAESGEGLIVRIANPYNRLVPVDLSAGSSAIECYSASILEEATEPVADGPIELAPFKFKTLLLK